MSIDRRSILFCALIALPFASESVGAQEPQVRAVRQIQTNSTIRVWQVDSQRAQEEGTLLEIRGDTLLFSGAGRVARIPFERLEQVDVSLGRSRSRGALKGAGYGALAVGAASTMLMLVIGSGDPSPPPGLEPETSPIVGAMLGVIYGAPLGAIIGVIVGSERWRTVFKR